MFEHVVVSLYGLAQEPMNGRSVEHQIDAIEQGLSNEIHSGFKWFYLIWKALYVTTASGDDYV